MNKSCQGRQAVLAPGGRVWLVALRNLLYLLLSCFFSALFAPGSGCADRGRVSSRHWSCVMLFSVEKVSYFLSCPHFLPAQSFLLNLTVAHRKEVFGDVYTEKLCVTLLRLSCFQNFLLKFQLRWQRSVLPFLIVVFYARGLGHYKFSLGPKATDWMIYLHCCFQQTVWFWSPSRIFTYWFF